MHINEKNLIVADFAYKTPERPHLNRISVEPDGLTVATNGHALCVVSPDQSIVNDVCGVTTDGNDAPAEPVSIDLNVAKEMRKDLKAARKKLLPAERVYFYAPNGRTKFVRPDDASGDRTIRPRENVDMKFSPWREVTGAADTNEYNEVAVDIRLLEMAVKALKAFRDDRTRSESKGATLLVPKNPLDPVVLKARNTDTDQDMTVVVMPMRL